jgi:hypothetical protein
VHTERQDSKTVVSICIDLWVNCCTWILGYLDQYISMHTHTHHDVLDGREAYFNGLDQRLQQHVALLVRPPVEDPFVVFVYL